MKYYAYFVVAMIWFLAGCSRPAFDVKENVSSSSQSAEQHTTSTTAPDTAGDTLVVNSFGMKFFRVEIDPPQNTNVSAPIPNESYFIQQTEVTREHLEEFYKFAKSNQGPLFRMARHQKPGLAHV